MLKFFSIFLRLLAVVVIHHSPGSLAIGSTRSFDRWSSRRLRRRLRLHLTVVAAACCRPGRLRLHLIVVGCLCCRQADSDSTSSSLAACAAARQTLTPPHRRWLPGSLSSRGTRHVRFDRSLLFSQITFGDEMCEDPRASYEAPFILHTLISGPGAAVSNSARTEKRTAQ